MIRTLITGASGFAGRHLITYLQAITPWELWGTTRTSALPPTVQHVQLDLLDRAAVARTIARIKPDLIFHLAAQSFVPTSFDDPVGTFNSNVLGQLFLLEAVAAAGIDPVILVVSSNEAYGMVQPSDLPIDEDTPLRPANPYAVSKAAQDLLAGQWYYTHKLRIVRVRPFNHIGPGQKASFVAPAFARQIAQIEQGLQPPVVCVGNLEARRDFTDVRDVVRAYYLAAVHGTAGAIYNIGSGEPVAVRELLEILIDLSSVSISIERDPARLRPAEVPLVACDASRLQAATGWHREYTLEQTLRDVLDDWRERVAQGSDALDHR